MLAETGTRRGCDAWLENNAGAAETIPERRPLDELDEATLQQLRDFGHIDD